MKDYSLGEEKKDYILKVKEVCEDVEGNDRSLNVYFADGSVIKGVEYSDENIEKIIDIQEEQAKKGVKNLPKFKKHRKVLASAAGLSFAGAGVGGSLLTIIPSVHEFGVQHPLITVAGVGAIAIAGAIPAFCKLVKENGKVKELEKIQYRDQHRQKLDNFKRYHNSLNGVSRKAYNSLISESDPFSILNIDGFEQNDLEMIMENIRKEEEFQFTYKRRPKRSK